MNDTYSCIEKRIAMIPRRVMPNRRHRIRTELLVSDCRTLFFRRIVDEEGFTNEYNLSEIEEHDYHAVQPHIEK